MLKKLTLENFKAFGAATEIELAPITLIFGQNSAGKSSILQSLNLLKQTHESRYGSKAALLPRADGGTVDLGSFQELLFDHDIKRKLRIGLEVSDTRYRKNAESNMDGIGINVGFRQDRSREIIVSDFYVSHSSIEEPLLEYSVKKASKAQLEKLMHPGILRRVRSQEIKFLAKCTSVSENPKIWAPFYEEAIKNKDKIVEAIMSEDEIDDMDILFEEDEIDVKTKRIRSKLYEEALEFYSGTFTLEQYINRFKEWSLEHRVAIDGFLPVREFMGSHVNRLPEFDIQMSAFRHRSKSSPRFNFFHSHKYIFRVEMQATRALDALFPLGPYRRPPERWYIFTGTKPVDVGYKGDHLPDLLYRDKNLLRNANKWLEKLEIDYELRVDRIGNNTDLFEVRLSDKVRKKKVDVALSDVGFGISQILPFIVQSLASKNRIISIEQPEVHIHPRLQADLGDLISEGIKSPYSHQYLIETHSEHLILRIQKLVRKQKIRAEDVSVLYVSRGPEGSDVERLHLDDEGDFTTEWPGGFFSERLRELY